MTFQNSQGKDRGIWLLGKAELFAVKCIRVRIFRTTKQKMQNACSVIDRKHFGKISSEPSCPDDHCISVAKGKVNAYTEQNRWVKATGHCFSPAVAHPSVPTQRREIKIVVKWWLEERS